MILPDLHSLTDGNSSSLIAWVFPRAGGGGGGGGRGGGGGGSRSGKSSSGKSSSSSSSSRGGSSKGSFSVPSSGKGSLSVSSSSRGGGTPTVIPSGTFFAGRLSGGGTRDRIFGNSRIGSGYPYGGYGTFYGGRPFPYDFYPIYFAPDYYGGDEYGPNMNYTRPGGPLSSALVQPITSSGINVTQNTYYLVGDESSVSVVLASLVSHCGILNSTVANTYINGTLNLNGDTLVPHPEQVVQYYRASSFALALSSYNNSATLISNAPTSNSSAPPPLSEDTPLPLGTNRTLLACLNSTISTNLPLPEIDSGSHRTWELIKNLSPLFLFGIGALMLLCALLAECFCRKRKKTVSR